MLSRPYTGSINVLHPDCFEAFIYSEVTYQLFSKGLFDVPLATPSFPGKALNFFIHSHPSSSFRHYGRPLELDVQT